MRKIDLFYSNHSLMLDKLNEARIVGLDNTFYVIDKDTIAEDDNKVKIYASKYKGVDNPKKLKRKHIISFDKIGKALINPSVSGAIR